MKPIDLGWCGYGPCAVLKRQLDPVIRSSGRSIVLPDNPGPKKEVDLSVVVMKGIGLGGRVIYWECDRNPVKRILVQRCLIIGRKRV